MKVLTLKIKSKTYTSTKITAYQAKEAIRINKEALKMAKLGTDLSEDNIDLDKADEIFETLEDISNRKSALICSVYDNKFTQEMLENELSTEEIDIEINKIIMGITGTIRKN